MFFITRIAAVAVAVIVATSAAFHGFGWDVAPAGSAPTGSAPVGSVLAGSGFGWDEAGV